MSVRSVGAGYGSGSTARAVLQDVSLDIPDGALTILVGPNGCGKSTLLKTMARILPASSGAVLLDGRPIHATPSRNVARRLAILPQGPVAPEGLTVRELVGQGRFPHQTLLRQMSRDDRRAIDAAMAAADVAQFADSPVSRLSGGQRQRCWIAMVLAQETDIILLDEPTTFLDLKVQVDLLVLLRRIAHRDGRTLVVVLHELNLAAAFADLLVMMKDGRIVAQGAVDATFTPQTLQDVFGLRARVLRDPDSGRAICAPVIDVPQAMAAQ
ncbi:ABC transporter ATP-binding protein [Mesobaculum littorinae]|uniref:ABC transporter ATP-binding protein n=1 Tax=Mesobaculum littorinae TaxID=2486419 RepID=A0A438ADT5_9RHOB|nr:ABC transporter ATP-binding protein [Mesobaculum littorinae]